MSSTNKALRADLVKLAFENPDLREELLPLIQDIGNDDYAAERVLTAMFGGEMSDKVGYNQETARFVAWVVDRAKKYDDGRAAKEVEKILGKAPLQYVKTESKRGKPLERGELIHLDRFKCANEENCEFAEAYPKEKGFYGTIDRVERDHVLVQMHKPRGSNIGRPIKLDGIKTGKATGMFRHSLMARIGSEQSKGKARIEVVYIPSGDNPPSMSDQAKFADYIKRGIGAGEERSGFYHTGVVKSFKYTKDGNLFILLDSDQRGRPTGISPSKGQLLYVGPQNKRPGGWKGALNDEVKMMLTGDLSKDEEAKEDN